MSKKAPAKNPTVELATKDWTMTQLVDTERRIEKAFHEQTQFLTQKLDTQNQKMDSNIRWMIGLIVTMTIAIIGAVLFK